MADFLLEIGIMELFRRDGLEALMVEEDNLVTEILGSWRIWVEKMIGIAALTYPAATPGAWGWPWLLKRAVRQSAMPHDQITPI